MIALNERPSTFILDGTGEDIGPTYATPVRTGKACQISVMIKFDDGDPGASVFHIEGSLDGDAWIPIDDDGALTGTDDTPLGFDVQNWPWLFVHAYQVSKANDVEATVLIAAV